MTWLGEYELLSQIGAGSSGTVWRAHRRHGPITQVVAVKRLRATDAGPDDILRLQREATVLTELDHPHIVRVLAVLPDGEGLAICMHYASGGSLEALLAARGRLMPGEVVALAAPIADALASAHRRGILHVDVKPANILFTSDGEPLLGDFGVARTLGRLTSVLGGNSAIAGTAHYLAPELLDGATPDPRSDVYSLGVVCYEALTGKRPYDAALPLAVLRAADVGRHEPLTSRPDVPMALARVVEQAMSRDPDDRPTTADQFATALRATIPLTDIRLPTSHPPTPSQAADTMPEAEPGRAPEVDTTADPTPQPDTTPGPDVPPEVGQVLDITVAAGPSPDTGTMPQGADTSPEVEPDQAPEAEPAPRADLAPGITAAEADLAPEADTDPAPEVGDVLDITVAAGPSPDTGAMPQGADTTPGPDPGPDVETTSWVDLRVGTAAAGTGADDGEAVEAVGVPVGAAWDEDPGATRTFGPRPPQSEDTPPRKRRLGLWVALAVVILGSGVAAYQLTRPSPDDDCPDAPLPPLDEGIQIMAGDPEGDGCRVYGTYGLADHAEEREDMVLTIVVDDVERRIRLGELGDKMFLGDWDCDGVETPGLYRWSDGRVEYYDTWPEVENRPYRPDDVERVDPSSRATLVTGGDDAGDGCDRIEVA